MKIIVDSLPYYRSDCPFEDNCYCDKKDCPRHWDKYKVGSEDNPHECYWLKESERWED